MIMYKCEWIKIKS